MKLLFIQGGSRWKFDCQGNVYTETNFNDSIWKRYSSYCDDLTVILRKEEKIYTREEASDRFNLFDTAVARHIAVPDLYRPVKNIFNVRMRREIKDAIDREVRNADRIIIRSPGNVYTNTALKCAKKYKKKYLVEVTGFVWEGMWYHSLRGKIVSFYKESEYKRLIKDVPYAVYVTQEELQKRYPSTGKKLGCSDVELPELEESVLGSRLEKIKKSAGSYVLGTAGFLDVRYKGQEYVIRALASLKKKGIDNIEYHLIGAGTGTRLKKLAKKLGVEAQVKVIGTLPHKEVFDWYDSIDIYIHPGFIEGLCRSIVEAMSRACPVICSCVGGNVELVDSDMTFEKGNVKEIETKIISLLDKEKLTLCSKRSFEKAKEFRKDLLDKTRDAFYQEFMR